MAKASLKVTRTKTRYKVKIKETGNKKQNVTMSSNKRGNQKHCPVCGKFI